MNDFFNGRDEKIEIGQQIENVEEMIQIIDIRNVSIGTQVLNHYIV